MRNNKKNCPKLLQSLVFLGLMLVLCIPAFAQRKPKVDTLAAWQNLQTAKQLEKAAKYDSAITCYQRASEGYKAYALSLPQKKKYEKIRIKAWEKCFTAQAKMGWHLNSLGKTDSALKILTLAEKECKAILPDHSAALVIVFNNIGGVSTYKGAYDEALSYYEKSLAIQLKTLGEQHPDIANSYYNTGIVYGYKGAYDEALRCYEKSLAIQLKTLGEQHPDVANSYYNIGIVYGYKGVYDKALQYQEKSLTIRLKTFGDQHPDVASIYNNIGSIYLRKGAYDEALSHLEKSLMIMRKTLGEQHLSVAINYSNIGNVYYDKGAYGEALSYYQKSLAARLKILGEQHPSLAVIYHNIGAVYQYRGAYDEALSYYQKSLAIKLKTLGELHPDVAINYQNIGNVYESKGAYDEALSYYQKSLAIQLKTLGKQHSDVADSYNSIASVYFHKGVYDEALNYYDKSLKSYLPDYTDHLYHKVNFTSPAALKGPLLGKPKALMRRSLTGDGTAALATICFADRFIDSLRKAYTYENDKLQLGENATKLYQIGIDVAIWNKTEPEAFYYSEKNKAAVLAQSLNESNALKLGGIPDSLIAKDKAFKVEIAYYSKSIIDHELKCPECDSNMIARFKNRLFELHSQYAKLKKQLEQNYPKYYALKYKNHTATVEELQTIFLKENPNTVILEYFLGDTVLFSFLVTRDRYLLYRQKLDSTNLKGINALQLETRQLARALGNPKLFLDPASRVAQPAEKLYNYLIKPFEAEIKGKDLLIIPDGELYKIPFEVLVANAKPKVKGQELTWRDLPYLVKSHNISYHYSATLLMEDWQKSKQPVKGDGLIAFAPVFNDAATGQIASNEDQIQPSLISMISRGDTVSRAFTQDGLRIAPLPGTEQEVKTLYNIFTQNNQPAKYYLHSEANEAAIKQLDLTPYKYIHFATHGLTDEDRPSRSSLILAQVPDSTEDNLLTAPELYGLELDAELVVLSACQTGKGKLKMGEGIIGLTRGLLYAGARNLVVSQWNVNDASTAELMTKFYEKLLSGQTNRQALREAKLELLNKYPCPHYWAPFILVGR